eukprot:gene13891-14011_t
MCPLVRYKKLSYTNPSQTEVQPVRDSIGGSGNSSRFPVVDAEEAKRLVEREGYKILDVRSAKDYDYGHITKPPRSSISAPVCSNDYASPSHSFLDEVTSAVPNNAAKLIVMCVDGGHWSEAALEQLSAAFYSAAVKLQGGYQGWQLVRYAADRTVISFEGVSVFGD